MVKITKPLNFLSYSVSLIGVSPLYIWLNLPAQILLPIALITGFYSEQKNRYIIQSQTATFISIGFFLFYTSQLNLQNVVIPVVNMLALLLAMRLITEKNSRNYLQIFVLSLFCLASTSMFSFTIFFFPALIFLVFGITIGLVLLTFHTREPGRNLTFSQLYTILKTASILPVVSLLLMFFFFAILPRTQYPLWNFLNPSASGTAGFSEEVRPGAFAGSAAVKKLAFRAQCRELPPEMLYWRGTVLNSLNGTVWRRINFPEEKVRAIGGETLQSTIYLPAKNDRFLFTLDPPLSVSGIRHTINSDLVFTSKRPLDKNTSFQVTTSLGGKLKILEPLEESFYLKLPADLSPELTEVAESIRAKSRSRKESITLLKNFFRKQNLTYAIDDLPGPQAPIEEFLFSKKRGYCEFFASSFALLLRMTDVPSRLVGGYMGGEYNNLGNYYRITEDMAHVWVEALVDKQWIRIDPTQLAQFFSTTPMGGQRQGLSLLRRTVDAIDYFWTQAVITYDLQKQVNLLKSTGKGFESLRKDWTWDFKKIYPVLWTILSVLLFRQVLNWKKRSREEQILNRYITAVCRKYRIKTIPATVGLHELASHLQDPVCGEFATIFGASLYSEHGLTQEEYQKLLGIIRILEKSKRQSRNTPLKSEQSFPDIFN